MLTAKKHLTEPGSRVRETVSDQVMPRRSLGRQAGISRVGKGRAGFLARKGIELAFPNSPP